MTTATEPPLIDEPSIGVDELPAFDAPDERVCQVPVHADECPPAAWVISGSCSWCGSRTLLACDRCKRRFERGGAKCDVLGTPVRITWMEPLL